jgi:hypothetical protein
VDETQKGYAESDVMLTLKSCWLRLAAAALLTFPLALRAQTGVLTWHNDAARSGQNLLETVLTPTNVNANSFGKLFTLSVDGKVDGQPLYVPNLTISSQNHNVLYVVTENDSVYAFDADTGTQLWQVSLLLGGEQPYNDSANCGQVIPVIGITSTPAIDLTKGPNGAIYAVAMSINGSNTVYQRLHALDLTTGAELFGGPVAVQAAVPGSGEGSSGGTTTFNPQQYKDRAALLISNGIVYLSFASHCDIQPYNAWVMGYNESTLAQVSVVDLTPDGDQGSVWQSGAGPAADAGGNLYFLLANGTFDTTLTAAGFPVMGDYGNAFMNMSTISGLSVQDYFTMENTVTESSEDMDLGSGGAMLLPTLIDSNGNQRALAVGAGKDGNAYVVDRNNMGKFNVSSNNVFQQIALGGSVFSSPAWFNNTLYYGPAGQPLEAFPFTSGLFATSPSSQSPTSFGQPGATPSISANGSVNGILWAAENSSPAVLHAYDATNLGTELYNSNQAANSRDQFGNGNKFITPLVANGKVYVGTTSGVGVFGLLNCTYAIFVGSNTSTGNTLDVTLNVTAPSGCSWSVANASNFITLTGASSGTGNGSVSFTAPADLGTTETGALVIAGHQYPVTLGGQTTTAGLAFYPLTPCRVVDTRVGFGFSGAFGPPYLAGGGTRSFPVPASFCSVPNTAPAYSFNITAVPPASLDYLTAWPAGSSTPGVATLNALSGAVVGNAAIVSSGTDGAISLFPSSDTNVVIDTNGYFAPPSAPQALAFYPVTPCRVADTRTGFGFTGPFGPPSLVGGATRNFPVQQSLCGIPSSAQAYSVRMTVVVPGSLNYLTTWPAGQTLPNVATLNALDGGVVGNEAIVPAGTATYGPISVFASDNTDLVIDINGYFAPPGSPGALYFYPLAPCRVTDTRVGFGFSGSFGPPALVGGASREFPMPSSSCGIPSSAQAYSLNVTAVPTDSEGWLTAYPAGNTVPNAATVNFENGQIVGSAAIVPAGTSGAINMYASSATDLVIDVNGYFAP